MPGHYARLTVTLCALLIAATLLDATEDKDFKGAWIMHLGQHNLFVLTLNPDGKGGFTGSLQRPTSFNASNGRFSEISNTPRQDSIIQSHISDGLLHFTTRNPTDATDQDAFTMILKGNHAELTLDDLPKGVVWDPFILERSTVPAIVSTDWDTNHVYQADDTEIPNAEMKAIFDEDQLVRSTAKIDWSVVSKSDAERREKTRKLLANGTLHTGKDFEEASFVFQHGDKPGDYLLAHTLAMVAVAKGDSNAIWISAATLDRYLESITQKQVFGTQYSRSEKTGLTWTQEPYDRDLISDALRRQLGVPNQAAQAKQLEEYQHEK